MRLTRSNPVECNELASTYIEVVIRLRPVCSADKQIEVSVFLVARHTYKKVQQELEMNNMQLQIGRLIPIFN